MRVNHCYRCRFWLTDADCTAIVFAVREFLQILLRGTVDGVLRMKLRIDEDGWAVFPYSVIQHHLIMLNQFRHFRITTTARTTMADTR